MMQSMWMTCRAEWLISYGFTLLEIWKSFGRNNQAKVVPLHRLSIIAMMPMVASWSEQGCQGIMEEE